MPPTAAELQKSVDDFTLAATEQIKTVGENAKAAYDELRNHVDGENAMSQKGRDECQATIAKLESELQGHESKQADLIKSLEDMHKQVSRVAAGGSAANDGTFVRNKSNIVSLEDYHKTAHVARGGDVDGYLQQAKSDDEIEFEKGFFSNLAGGSNKASMEKLQSSLIQANSLIVSHASADIIYVCSYILTNISHLINEANLSC